MREWWIKENLVNPYDYAFRLKPLSEALSDSTHVIEKSGYDDKHALVLALKAECSPNG